MLPDGRHVIAGRFSLVSGEPAYRLARLNEDLTLDESFVSPLEPLQFVDDVQLDGGTTTSSACWEQTSPVPACKPSVCSRGVHCSESLLEVCDQGTIMRK
jgi:hypothetical protein